MNDLDLSHIENSVVEDGALILKELLIEPKRLSYRMTPAQVHELEAYVGRRLTRLILRRAGFRPGPEEGWQSEGHSSRKAEVVKLDFPQDLRICLDDLDNRGRLKAALGLVDR